MINILLLLLGTFMDLAPMLLICTPIFLPVILKFGIDPVHFGMIMILNLGHRPDHAAGRADALRRLRDRQGDDGAGVAELWPFYGAMCVALLLVTYVPAISLWLPHLLAR